MMQDTDDNGSPGIHLADGLAAASAGVMVGRREACAMFGVALRTWSEWERAGRVCGRLVGGRRMYEAAYLNALLEEARRKDEPYPDPQRPGCYRVPVVSRLHRMEAVIDAESLPLVKGRRWNWSPGHREGTGSVIIAMRGTPKPALHQIIMGVEGREKRIGHLNGDPLDCRRENLVVRTASEQARNARKMRSKGGKECSSRFKGVRWTDEGRKWTAVIRVGGKTVQLGRFRCEIDAAEAYDAAARELFGEHARLNIADPAEADRLRALNPVAPIDTTWPPPGMMDRYDACRMFDISLTAWLVWERKGRIACATWHPLPSGKSGRCKLYPIVELERLREEFSRLGKPYADPDRPGVYRVPLRSHIRHREVMIDAEDLPLVDGRNWNWAERSGGLFDGCAVLSTMTGTQVPLHRIIAGVESGEERVSFVNGDPLDCRRANLVVRSHEEQARGNRKMGTVSGRVYTSKYKGVSWSEPRGKWVAQISKGEMHRNIGRFDDEIAAAEAYDEAARQLFGEHARLNFPDGVDARLQIEAASEDARAAA